LLKDQMGEACLGEILSSGDYFSAWPGFEGPSAHIRIGLV